jgi:hypothetical protein
VSGQPGGTPAARRRIGLLHGGASYHLRTLADPVVAAYRAEPLYLPDLSEPAVRERLDAVDTLVVFDRLHPDLVRRHAGALLSVAHRGGTLVVLGKVDAHAWLPGLEFSDRPTNFWWWRTGEDPGIHRQHPEHPIWTCLDERDVVWHYHGLLHPGPGVTPLASVTEAGAPAGLILYDDRVSTPGRLLVTTMDPVHHHGGNFMPAATRLLYGLLRWLAADPGTKIAAR